MKNDYPAKEAWDADPAGFFHALTGEEVWSWEPEPLEMTQTVYRLADRLYRAVFGDGKERLVLVEVQAQNDFSMLVRLLLYLSLALEAFFSRYKRWALPRAYVLYIGAEPFTAPTEIHDEGHLFFKPTYINVRTVPYARFLNLKHAAQVVFAVLSDDAKDRADVVERIIEKVTVLCEGRPNERKKHLLTLIRYSRFRNMEKMVIPMVERVWEDALPEEQILQDPLYLRGVDFGEKRGFDLGEKHGIDIGKDQANRDLTLNLHKNGFDAETISRLTGLPLKFVRQVLKETGGAVNGH
jgi:predicted transposase/invertase (TIGR01784 family)